MFPSSDSNHNSNIRLELLKLNTKRNIKPVFPFVVQKLTKNECFLKNFFALKTNFLKHGHIGF